MAVISYLSVDYGLDCKINVINDLSTPKTPLIDILHTYVCHTSQKLLITLYPRWPRPPSWIPENAQCLVSRAHRSHFYKKSLQESSLQGHHFGNWTTREIHLKYTIHYSWHVKYPKTIFTLQLTREIHSNCTHITTDR